MIPRETLAGKRSRYCKICRTYWPKQSLAKHHHSVEEIEVYIAEYRAEKQNGSVRAELQWLETYLK